MAPLDSILSLFKCAARIYSKHIVCNACEGQYSLISLIKDFEKLSGAYILQNMFLHLCTACECVGI